jgi:hypothetical protein
LNLWRNKMRESDLAKSRDKYNNNATNDDVNVLPFQCPLPIASSSSYPEFNMHQPHVVHLLYEMAFTKVPCQYTDT